MDGNNTHYKRCFTTILLGPQTNVDSRCTATRLLLTLQTMAQQCTPVRGVLDGAAVPGALHTSASQSLLCLFRQIFSRKSCRTAVRFCMWRANM